MDSGKNFDQCAVCDGAGNTCTKVSGTFKSGGKERGIDYTVLHRSNAFTFWIVLVYF